MPPKQPHLYGPYLSTILDDYCSYIITCKLCTKKKTADVTDTLESAVGTLGSDRGTVEQKLLLLSDNGLY